MKCPTCQADNPSDSQFCNMCGSAFGQISGTLTYPLSEEARTKEELRFSPGERFGERYTIIEEIGRGGMGKVYKAEDKELGTIVALKMIRPELSSRPRMVEQFRKETLLGRAVTHENVVRIHDLGEIDKIKYISMDYIKGENLLDLIQTSGTLTLATCLHITGQICQALKAAHHKGIIHQDLKPQNLMIDNSGKVYVMDFGLAKSVAVAMERPAKRIFGTPRYFSPEQARGEEVDQTSDIYSLGVMMYEMTTGNPPFQADSIEGYIHKHVSQRPSPPSKINPAIPPSCEKIILKCLEKKKEDRYQNIEELLKDLEESARKSKHFLARAKASRWFGFMAVATLILTAVIWLYLSNRGRKTAGPSPNRGIKISLAVMYFENVTGDKNLDYWRQSLSYQLIQALLQSKYIRVLTWDRLLDILEQLNLQKEQRYSWEALKKVALRGGVNHILQGNFTKAGETYRINTLLQDARTGEVIAPETVEGTGEESLISMVDQLTMRVKADLKLSKEEITSDYEKAVGKIITGSPEAMKDYMEGLTFHKEGKFSDSLRALDKAVAVDPGFALAYRVMSENYRALGEFDRAKKNIQMALSLIDRVSERERYLIQGNYCASFDASNKGALDNYKKLLELYPDDEDGNIYLGALYRESEEWDLARQYFEKAHRIDDAFEITYANLAYIFMAQGLYDKARQILLTGQNKIPDSAILHQYAATVCLAQGRLDFALLELEKASSLAPDDYLNIQLAGKLYQVQGDWSNARKAYQKLLEKDDPEVQNLGQFCICLLDLAQGKYESCKKRILLGIDQAQSSRRKRDELNLQLLLAYVELQLKHFPQAVLASNQAMAIASDINFIEEKMLAFIYRGLAYLATGNSEGIEKTAAELKQSIERVQAPKLLRYYNYLMAEIAVKKGLVLQAIDYLEICLSLLPFQHTMFDENAFFLGASAAASYSHGNLEKARELYQSIISLTTGRLGWGDIYARSFYWLGKIYQKKEMTEKAIEHYETFLRVWNEADPGLPETKDAQKQLSALSPPTSKKELFIPLPFFP